jgi:hypothetical protein
VTLKTRRPKADFFASFEEAARNNIEAANLLDQLCREFRDPEAMVARLLDLEHKGDEIAHRVYESFHSVFMPPLDREDIVAITTGLDDILDHIHDATDGMRPSPDPAAGPEPARGAPRWCAPGSGSGATRPLTTPRAQGRRAKLTPQVTRPLPSLARNRQAG